jgi:alginate O-acetyltransferase complex protein AlgI
MLFNSIHFLLFFTIVTALYFAIPYRFRWALLLTASYIFYMISKPSYIILIIILTLVSYYISLQMGKTEIKFKKRGFLVLAISVHLGLLFLFKYYDFFNSSFKDFLNYYHLSFDLPAVHFVLPLGISFYTFKSLSYAIDVYRGHQSPERHLGYFALFVAFFPQLLAGPIERGTRFLPQLYGKFDFEYPRVTRGLKLMLWGLFQKMVIADNLATLVDPIYSHPTQYQGITLVLATLFYSFQIYCDFSGYSDIAIGAAQVLGIKTMDNFNRPYFSQSIPEFWRRWHISLSTWFRDYLYIPLGGSRVSISRLYFNLFIVMLICGFWHGANWTFLIWGGLHGFYLVFSVLTRGLRDRTTRMIGWDRMPKLRNFFRVLITFSLVCFAWIFFRANTISDAIYIIPNLFSGWGTGITFEAFREMPFGGALKSELVVSVIGIGILLVVHLIERRENIIDWFLEKPIWLRWSVYYSIILSILLVGNFGSKQFIYFQF